MKKTFGLTEIIVGAVILATIFGGIISTFLSVRRYLNHSRRRLDAAYLARHYLSLLHNYVFESGDGGDGWSDSSTPGALWAVNSGTTSHDVADPPISDSPPAGYGATYTVEGHDSDDDSYHDYRKVVIAITYPYE